MKVAGLLAAGLCLCAACQVAVQAQGVRDTIRQIGPPGLEVVPEDTELFFLNRVPALRTIDKWQSRLDELSPLKCGVENFFLSDWLDKGANDAKHGLQIQQNYFCQWTRPVGNAFAGVGFEYFQMDTTGKREMPGSSTLERDFIIYAPIEWNVFYLSPFWDSYIWNDSEDNNELGSNFMVDTILHPAFSWSYNFTKQGAYFQWGLSHDIDIALREEKLATLTGSAAMGMDVHQRTTITTLSSLDWGLNLTVPLTRRFFVSGLLHFTKSLSRAKDKSGERYYEDIVPWAGLKLSMVF